MSLRILVTGGAGFIGSRVADRYQKEGHQVTIVDNLVTGVEKNVPAVGVICLDGGCVP